MVSAGSNTTFMEAMRLQEGLISYATGNSFGNDEYQKLRARLVQNSAITDKIPRFIRDCRDLTQFWAFIRDEYPTYALRRQFLWESFRPLLVELEFVDRRAAVAPMGRALQAFDPNEVSTLWQKALARIQEDPEGAVTAATITHRDSVQTHPR
jgi:hypothetical protein